jgi:hypothetical protein
LSVLNGAIDRYEVNHLLSFKRQTSSYQRFMRMRWFTIPHTNTSH